MKTAWQKRKEIDREAVKSFSEKTGSDLITAEILLSREITAEEAEEFFAPGIKNLDELSLVHPLQKAVDRILDALENEEKITIYGDFDCDGTIGSAILYDYLQKADGDVEVYIPDRITEGYGLNKEAVGKLKAGGTSLIITVDTGITALEEVDLINELGMDVIITDHHRPLDTLPQAGQIIDFKCLDYPYFTEVCGAAVSFFLVLILNQIIDLPIKKAKYAELLTIATIADIVELRHFNRDLVKTTLTRMNEKKIYSEALKSLINVADVDEISMNTAGFKIAPMINAAGRIGNADKVIELFTTDDQQRRDTLSEYLYNLNVDRMNLEKQVLEEAEQVLTESGHESDEVLIISKKHWHSGVIGIVASRIQEKTGKPVIIISFDEDGIGHGSCRSTSKFDIFKALDSAGKYLEKYGGHTMAAGLTIKEENLEAFREEILKTAREKGLEKNPGRELLYDVTLPIEAVDLDLAESLEKLTPFGVSNPEPKLRVTGVKIKNPTPVGQDSNHMAFDINGIRGVYFNYTDSEEIVKPGGEILAKLRINCYNNTVQLVVIDHQLNPFKNFHKAEEVIREANTNAELVESLSGFGKRNMINRSYLVKIYQLAKKAQNRGIEVKALLDKSKTTLVDLVIALTILKEANLLDYRYNNGILRFKLIPQKEKVDLTETKTFRLLHSEEEINTKQDK